MTLRCPNCSASSVVQRIVPESLPYGSGGDAVLLNLQLPIRHCDSCGEEWEDVESFRAKHDAVCMHLGRLTSREIAIIRTSVGSRERFSELTGIGPASLARWESGSLMQNAAYDLLLRAIADSELRERLFSLRIHATAASAQAAMSPAMQSLDRPITDNGNVVPIRREFRPRALTAAEELHARNVAKDFQLTPQRLVRVSNE